MPARLTAAAARRAARAMISVSPRAESSCGRLRGVQMCLRQRENIVLLLKPQHPTATPTANTLLTCQPSPHATEPQSADSPFGAAPGADRAPNSEGSDARSPQKEVRAISAANKLLRHALLRQVHDADIHSARRVLELIDGITQFMNGIQRLACSLDSPQGGGAATGPGANLSGLSTACGACER